MGLLFLVWPWVTLGYYLWCLNNIASTVGVIAPPAAPVVKICCKDLLDVVLLSPSSSLIHLSVCGAQTLSWDAEWIKTHLLSWFTVVFTLKWAALDQTLSLGTLVLSLASDHGDGIAETWHPGEKELPTILVKTRLQQEPTAFNL